MNNGLNVTNVCFYDKTTLILLVEDHGNTYRIWVRENESGNIYFIPQYIDTEYGEVMDLGDFDQFEFTWEETVDLIRNDK